MNDVQYNDWALISQSSLPVTVLALVCFVIGAAGALSVWSYLRAGRKQWPLAALHALGAVLLIVFIAQPAIDWRQVSKVPGRIAIVVDDSASMASRDDEKESRFARVNTFLEQSKVDLDALAEDNVIEWYSLSQTGRPTEARATESGLVDAVLRPARQTASARPLVSVVLVSDGADTSDFFRASEGARKERLAALASLDVPLNTIAVGQAGALDLFIEHVAQDAIAFVRNTARIEVTVGMQGSTRARALPVSLWREGELVSQQTVDVTASAGGGASGKVTFEFVPDQVGEFVYSVSVPEDPSETLRDNNRSEFILRVVRDKIRVLLVAGRPSWDQRFLRRALRSSPNVDLISFFILRTPTDFQDVPNDELSLIPFPTNELFNTELHTFDVVVFDNFDYRPYHMGYLLQNVRDHVHNGGALVMFGGESSFAGGAYGQTPLADVLPVQVSEGTFDAKPFVPVLTPAGEKHPVLRLGASTQSRQSLIQKLPPLPTSNDADGLAPQSTALLVHPTRKSKDGSPLPIIAVRDVGKGRTMAVLTDGIWRWAFTDKMRGDTGGAYDRFLSQMLRWLMRDPEVSKLQLQAARENVQSGDTLNLTVRALGSDYRPQAGAAVTVRIVEAGVPAVESAVTTGEDGSAQVPYVSRRGGVVRVNASAEIDEERSEASLLVYATAADAERRAMASRPEQLEWLAASTGGQAQELGAAKWSKVKTKEAKVVSVDRHREVSLWSTWPAFALVCLVLSTEWWLRRRAGYV